MLDEREKIAKSDKLQELYELQKSLEDHLEPTELIEEVGRLIDQFKFATPNFKQNGIIIFDEKIDKTSDIPIALHTSIANKASTLLV